MDVGDSVFLLVNGLQPTIFANLIGPGVMVIYGKVECSVTVQISDLRQ